MVLDKNKFGPREDDLVQREHCNKGKSLLYGEGSDPKICECLKGQARRNSLL